VAQKHKLTPRETAQVCAALRTWGRWLENAVARDEILPHMNPLVQARFKDHPPMTLDEIETLIGRLDGSWTGRGLRRWDALRFQ
jgi:hypothetical protein